MSIEVYFHRKRLDSIKYRIHVNGTRGKSSVTRLIAAGLRAGGVRNVAKTTGTMARFIDPDGVEEAVFRFSRTNVIEQVRIVRQAMQYKPEALVIECMAVQPLLQSLCELKLVRSTHGVLVNAKADHLDVMGPTERDVALALAGTVPIRGEFFTTEERHLGIFEYAVKDRQSKMFAIGADGVANISDADMEPFSYAEHKSNVALALAVCEHLGVARHTALEGMWAAKPDPGALTIFTVKEKAKTLILANGFAANDAESTKLLWHDILKKHPDCDKVIGLVNCRDDRADRSTQMAESFGDWTLPTECMAIGTGTDSFIKRLDKNKIKGMKLTAAENWSLETVIEHLTADEIPETILLIGICNIKDIGFALLNYFESHREKL